MPSGKVLARTMASYVDPRIPGPIVELGPGTGPVTDALIRRGVAQDRLILVEFNPEFCQLLKRRFPKATIIQGDAYDLQETLLRHPAGTRGRHRVEPAAFHQTDGSSPRSARIRRRPSCIRMRRSSSSPTRSCPPSRPAPTSIRASGSDRIWRNLPPARVWVYNKVKTP